MVNLQLDDEIIKRKCLFVTSVGQNKSEPMTRFQHKNKVKKGNDENK